MKREDFLKIADRCGVIDLYDDGEAYVITGNVGDWIECMRAVEQATLERAAKKFRENAELCADWMEHTKSMYLDGADILDKLKDSND